MVDLFINVQVELVGASDMMNVLTMQISGGFNKRVNDFFKLVLDDSQATSNKLL